MKPYQDSSSEFDKRRGSRPLIKCYSSAQKSIGLQYDHSLDRMCRQIDVIVRGGTNNFLMEKSKKLRDTKSKNGAERQQERSKKRSKERHAVEIQ